MPHIEKVPLSKAGNLRAGLSSFKKFLSQKRGILIVGQNLREFATTQGARARATQDRCDERGKISGWISW
jgi:hypothetical protein